MSPQPILEPVEVDWVSVLRGVDRTSPGQRGRDLERAMRVICNAFSLTQTGGAKLALDEWLRNNSSTTGQMVREVLKRTPIRPRAEVDAPDLRPRSVSNPAALVVGAPAAPAVEAASPESRFPVFDVGEFPSSQFVIDTLTTMSQPLKAKTPREEFWSKLLEPFSRADTIFLCEPWAVSRAVRPTEGTPLDSGLAFFTRCLGELARREGELKAFRIVSLHPNWDEGDFTRNEVQSFVDSLASVADDHLDITVTVVKRRSKKLMHDRYFVARKNSLSLRVLQMSDSYVPDSSNTHRPDRVMSVILHTHPASVSRFDEDWRQLTDDRNRDFRIASSPRR